MRGDRFTANRKTVLRCKPQHHPALRDHSDAEADVAEAEESKSLVSNSHQPAAAGKGSYLQIHALSPTSRSQKSD